MTRIFATLAASTLAALCAVAAAPALASSKSPIEGRWANPKGSVIVQVERCGAAYCARVASANAKAQAKARQGGTPRLIGTHVLTGLRPAGNGAYKGRAFDPKRNIRAPATVRAVGPNTLLIKGCVITGVLCKEQRWTRVGG
jgi:uncharacterized protein (DUF2147 family)